MRTNVGHFDRIIRAVLGIGLVGFTLLAIYNTIAVTLSTFWAVVLIVVGVILLLNAIFGWSLLYALLRIDTYKAEESFCPISHTKPAQ